MSACAKAPPGGLAAGASSGWCGLPAGTRGRQIADRFGVVTWQAFAYGTAAQRQEWQALIATLEQSLRLHRHAPGQLLKLAGYLHERTDWMIGSPSHLIRGAAVDAILDGAEKITREHSAVSASIRPPRPPGHAGRTRGTVMIPSPEPLRQLPFTARPFRREATCREMMLRSVPAEWFLQKKLLKQAADLNHIPPEIWAEYVRCFNEKTIRGCCADYRAGAGIDCGLGTADLSRKLQMPILVLWGASSSVGRHFADPLALWRQRAEHVQGEALPSSHYVNEEAPEQVLDWFLRFFHE